MKVYSNLNGNNDKINASEIAIKKDDNVFLLDERLNNLKLTKLWQNPKSTEEFSSQTISLNSDDYDYYIILSKNYKSIATMISEFSLKGLGVYINMASDYGVSGTYYASTYIREVKCISDTSLSIGDCYVRYGNNTSRSTANSNIIPYIIFGGHF
jgi:hypothetical protein